MKYKKSKIKKKYALVSLLILVLLSINGCGNRSRRDNTEVKLQSGTKGLTLEFMKNFPEEVVEEGRLYASFELRNEGFFDIKQGILVLSLEKDFMEIDSWELPETFKSNSDNTITFDLNGKTISNIMGEKQVASAVIKTKKIDDTRNKIESMIVVNACYPYATILSETICIDTDPNELRIVQKTCKVKDITSSSQGAPVAITKVEQKIIPGSDKDNVGLQFTILAENKDDGLIIDQNKYKDICIGRGSSKEDYNKLILKSLKFSDFVYRYGQESDLECEPNPLKETREGYFTRCTLKEENSIPKTQPTFETPIVIELSYGYKTTESEEIDIINSEPEFI